MEGAEDINPEVIEILRGVAKDGSEIEDLVNELNKLLDGVHSPHAQQQYASINAKYSTVLAKLDKIIRQSQLALSKQEGTLDMNTFSPIPNSISNSSIQTVQQPEKEEPKLHIHKAHHMFELFCSREMPICDMPYPSLCGSIPANPNEKIPVDEFVASQIHGDEYVLCYVAGYDGDDYLIVDADEADPQPIKKTRSEILPLPTSLPSQKSSRVEYSVGTKVLALYPTNEDEWTSVFYPATVVQVPSKHVNGYGLKFEDDENYERIDVQENFVIRDPQGK